MPILFTKMYNILDKGYGLFGMLKGGIKCIMLKQ
nr:MAG TPA: hypothetical protein [Caudoviricetes sp.]